MEVLGEDTRRMFLEATSGAGCHLEGEIWFCNLYWFFISNLLENNEKETDKHYTRKDYQILLEAYLEMNWIDPMDSFLIVSYHCDFYFEMG